MDAKGMCYRDKTGAEGGHSQTVGPNHRQRWPFLDNAPSRGEKAEELRVTDTILHYGSRRHESERQVDARKP